MKYVLLPAILLLAAAGCHSDAYYQEQAVESAREFIFKHARELTPEQYAEVKFTPPVILSGQIFVPVGQTKAKDPAFGEEKRQICITWRIYGAKTDYLVYGVSEPRMAYWRPLRLIRRKIMPAPKGPAAALAKARRYAVTSFNEVLDFSELNKIRFTHPSLLLTSFPIQDMDDEEEAARETEKPERQEAVSAPARSGRRGAGAGKSESTAPEKTARWEGASGTKASEETVPGVFSEDEQDPSPTGDFVPGGVPPVRSPLKVKSAAGWRHMAKRRGEELSGLDRLNLLNPAVGGDFTAVDIPFSVNPRKIDLDGKKKLKDDTPPFPRPWRLTRVVRADDEKYFQLSLVWPLKDDRYAVFCGVGLKSLKEWEICWAGIISAREMKEGSVRLLQKPDEFLFKLPPEELSLEEQEEESLKAEKKKAEDEEKAEEQKKIEEEKKAEAEKRAEQLEKSLNTTGSKKEQKSPDKTEVEGKKQLVPEEEESAVKEKLPEAVNKAGQEKKAEDKTGSGKKPESENRTGAEKKKQQESAKEE